MWNSSSNCLAPCVGTLSTKRRSAVLLQRIVPTDECAICYTPETNGNNNSPDKKQKQLQRSVNSSMPNCTARLGQSCENSLKSEGLDVWVRVVIFETIIESASKIHVWCRTWHGVVRLSPLLQTTNCKKRSQNVYARGTEKLDTRYGYCLALSKYR